MAVTSGARVKLSVTEYEREQLAMARQVVGELNANLARRDAGFRFAVTLAGNDTYFVPDLDGILAAAGDEPRG